MLDSDSNSSMNFGPFLFKTSVQNAMSNLAVLGDVPKDMADDDDDDDVDEEGAVEGAASSVGCGDIFGSKIKKSI